VFGVGPYKIESDHSLLFDYLNLHIFDGILQFDGKATFNGYTSVSGSVTLSPQGAVDNIDLGPLEIEEASINVFVGPVETKVTGTMRKGYHVSINGAVHFAGVRVRAGLFFDKRGPDVGWTLGGEHRQQPG
jgi:hypothetical protein